MCDLVGVDVAIDFEEYERTSWAYYLILEERFKITTRYISLDIENFPTFSYELFDQLMLICAEIETTLKRVTGIGEHSIGENGRQRNTTIKDLVPRSLELLPELKEIQVQLLQDKNISFMHFQNLNFDSNGPLFSWWTEHNHAKHDRLNMEQCENLENVLKALSALYTLHIAIIRSFDNGTHLPRQISAIFTYSGTENKMYSGTEIQFLVDPYSTD